MHIEDTLMSKVGVQKIDKVKTISNQNLTYNPFLLEQHYKKLNHKKIYQCC